MKKIIKIIGVILVVVAIGIGALFTVLFTVGRNKAGNADLAEETKSQESDKTAPESEPEKQLIENFEVSHTSETIPSKMMEFTEVNVGGKNVKKYQSAENITFGAPSAYTQTPLECGHRIDEGWRGVLEWQRMDRTTPSCPLAQRNQKAYEDEEMGQGR